MIGTRDVVRALARANPEAKVTEDRIRWVLRRGLIPSLDRVGGRLVWTVEEVRQLAEHLDLESPVFDEGRRALPIP